MFIDGLPHIPYDKGVDGYIGVAAHATGNYGGKFGDNVMAERNFEVETWGSAFVHYFCDDNGILQIADINYKAYGAGRNANGKYVHVELCQSKDKEKALKGYANWVYILAFVLARKKLGVIDTRTLVSHQWISQHLGGTDHQDPIAYLSTFGKTWADVVKDVQAEYYKQTAPVVPQFTVDGAVDLICKKIRSVDNIYWKKQAHSVQYFDIFNTKVATQWAKETTDKTPVIKLPPQIKLTLDEALAFIDSKVHLSDMPGWKVKAKNVPYMDMYFIKIAYVWQREGMK
jgi:N-acetylmuramoyl-L-alanine amidase CwlA